MNNAAFKVTTNVLEKELPFKVQLPKFFNLVIVGDLIREIVAHEVALKISETSYLPVRSFGLEEFLHGPELPWMISQVLSYSRL
jgi:glucosamine 6-phosphate synthetase-like amidotransferase/phosphosugar isomerase protein